ncbi:MAG: DUF2959 family protein [Planctomycetota bacterium]
MKSFTARVLVLVPLLAGCNGLQSFGIKQSGGLEGVDELLGHVEQVQVDSAVSKERAQGALEALRTLIGPEFKGDAVQGHAALVAAIEESETQAEALQGSVRPLRKTGESVFARWSEDLESFGNIAMRQRSQERLEESRRRYDAVLAAAVSAQLAYDAFNGDLGDHALFLENDFNASAVQVVAAEFDGLKSRGKELGKRLDAVVAACQAYVEFAAPKAQVEPAPTTEVAPAAPAEPAPAPAPAKKPTPKKKVMTKPAPESSGNGN